MCVGAWEGRHVVEDGQFRGYSVFHALPSLANPDRLHLAAASSYLPAPAPFTITFVSRLPTSLARSRPLRNTASHLIPFKNSLRTHFARSLWPGYLQTGPGSSSARFWSGQKFRTELRQPVLRGFIGSSGAMNACDPNTCGSLRWMTSVPAFHLAQHDGLALDLSPQQAHCCGGLCGMPNCTTYCCSIQPFDFWAAPGKVCQDNHMIRFQLAAMTWHEVHILRISIVIVRSGVYVAPPHQHKRAKIKQSIYEVPASLAENVSPALRAPFFPIPAGQNRSRVSEVHLRT